MLDAEQFQRCFVAWVAALTGAPEGALAIDGKTLRRSGRKNGCNPAIHMVSAFAARQRLVLGQVKVAEKSNEIIAIPKLLDMLAIEGTIVTIDAMGCQRNIAQKIVDRKADYVLALKGNQGSLREDVELFVAEQKAAGFKHTTISRDQTVDGDHGRIETRAPRPAQPPRRRGAQPRPPVRRGRASARHAPPPAPARARDCLRYLEQTRQQTFDASRALVSRDDALLAGGFVHAMLAQHEAQHTETILQTIQLIDDLVYEPPRRREPAGA